VKNPIVITPVKDSLATTSEVVRSLRTTNQELSYYIFDDFSSKETRKWLEENASTYGYKIIGLEKHTRKSSPNYRTALILARNIAIENGSHLIIVESDVFAKNEIILQLNQLAEELADAGLVGSVTVNSAGEINFPYTYAASKDKPAIFASDKSLSFCCTLLSLRMLEKFDFNELPNHLDWFDVFISRKSRQLGFTNYVVKSLPVVHQPHSSRPWKQLKYKNPILYYLKKIINHRDRI
jgi:GT2 family glycosyltransferase